MLNNLQYKIIINIIFIIFFIHFPIKSHTKLDKKLHIKDFSNNIIFHIDKIIITKYKKFNHPFLKKIFGLRENQDYWAWEIKKILNQINNSGYIEEKSLNSHLIPTSKSRYYNLVLSFQENPTIRSIEIINTSNTKSSYLLDFLDEYNFIKDGIYNSMNYHKGIKDFLLYYQKLGVFLINISKEIKRDEKNDTVQIKIYIFPIKQLIINSIKVQGANYLSYDKMLRLIHIRLGYPITSDSILDKSFIKLKQTGLFSEVYYNFKKINRIKDEVIYCDLVIEVIEVDQSNFTTTTLYKNTIGPIFLAQYIHLNINGKRDRFLAQAGYEVFLNTVSFILEYTKPDLNNIFFLSTRLQKEDFVLQIADNSYRLSEKYSIRLTFGLNIVDFFSSYIFAKEIFTKEKVIDRSGDKITTPTGLVLNDNTFQTEVGLILSYNNLNDTFNPFRGIRAMGSYSIIPEGTITQLFNGQLDFYFKLNYSFVLGFFFRGDYVVSNTNSSLIYAYSNRKTDAQIRNVNYVKASGYGAMELRISTRKLLDDSYFVIFFEGGSIWERLSDFNPLDFGYGVGIGLRWSPSKYHHSFLFGFPGSINIGIKLSESGYKSPSFTFLQHRDQYYYLNLTGGF